MKKSILIMSLLVTYATSSYVNANDNHDHASNHDHENEKDEHNHSESGHDDEHAHSDEENPQVGPNKGILAASEEEGIKLSPEAEKNFEIQKIKFVASGAFEIPKGAVVTAGLEVNLYRYRAGFYKRIDFEQISKSENKIQIRSKDLKQGDEIAITGLGFLRIAEIAAFGGAPEGHSH